MKLYNDLHIRKLANGDTVFHHSQCKVCIATMNCFAMISHCYSSSRNHHSNNVISTPHCQIIYTTFLPSVTQLISIGSQLWAGHRPIDQRNITFRTTIPRSAWFIKGQLYLTVAIQLYIAMYRQLVAVNVIIIIIIIINILHH